MNRKLYRSDNRLINYEWSYTLMNDVFPESFCVNIYFPSKASLLNECHSDCSLSKKKEKEKENNKKICIYEVYM